MHESTRSNIYCPPLSLNTNMEHIFRLILPHFLLLMLSTAIELTYPLSLLQTCRLLVVAHSLDCFDNNLGRRKTDLSPVLFWKSWARKLSLPKTPGNCTSA